MEFTEGGIAITYNHRHPPVLYGSIAYMHSNDAVDGKVTPQWSAPFLLSKHEAMVVSTITEQSIRS